MKSPQILLLLILLFSCSAPTDVANGGGTATGNPYIVGVAVADNGEPLSDHRISVEPTDGNESQYHGKEFDREGYTYTDSEGRYEFSLTRTGEFDINIWYDSVTVAAVVPCVVESADKSIELDTVEVDIESIEIDTATINSSKSDTIGIDTLTGTVRLQGIALFNYPIALKVLGTDIDMAITPDSLFEVPLSEGTYDVVIYSGYGLFEPDTLFDVSSDEDLDTITVRVFELSALSYKSDSTIVEYLFKLNDIVDVSVEDITTTSESPKRIISLTLTGEKYSTLPSVIRYLTQLEEITINNTGIETLPDEIEEMQNLQKIVFSSK